MKNNNIILFILIICVIYLLYCNGRKEQFTSTSTNLNKQDQMDDNLSYETKNSTIITESIKNLGILAKKIHNDNGDFTFPANLNVTGKFNIANDNNFLPAGTVIMWTNANFIPDGWVACDGKNDTPDLRGRFVLGAGQGTDLTNRSLGENGGEETHKLTESEMPTHNHHIYTDPVHGRLGPIFTVVPNGGNRNLDGGGWRSESVNTDSKGNDKPHNNMPPYYVLIYIMKVYESV